MRLVVGMLDLALEVYRWILLARVLMSWVPNVDPRNRLVRFIYDVTDLVLMPFRNLLPPVGGLDLSPILVFFLINVIRRALSTWLLWLIL